MLGSHSSLINECVVMDIGVDSVTDSDDAFNRVERRGGRKRLRKSQFKQDWNNILDKRESSSLKSTTQPAVCPFCNLINNLSHELLLKHSPEKGSLITSHRPSKALMVGSKSSSGTGYEQLKAAQNWTTFLDKAIY